MSSPSGVSSQRLASPRVVAAPRIASPERPTQSPLAQFTSQRTRTIVNLTAVAAAPSSRVQSFRLEDVSLVDYEIARNLPLYLSAFIFGESENKELRQYVKKRFNLTHLESILLLTFVESVSVPFINGAVSPYGPLVKDKERTMNLRSLCSAPVNYRWL